MKDLLLPDHYKKILVTGGLGFIGSALIRRLLKNTSAKIFNLDKISYSSDESSINQIIKNNSEFSNRYTFFKMDLFRFEETNKLIRTIKPDLIFHLAAESHVDRSIDNPLIFLESNVIGTYNLLEATKNYLKKSKTKNFRFIHISTDEVFGELDENGFFNEESSYSPKSPYSASKASSDHFVRAWNKTYGLPTIITNCSNNYGPWQYPEKLIPLTIFKALIKQKISIYGDGLNVRDWLYVEDHISALCLIASNGKIGESYCIGANNEKTNKFVVEKICDFIDEKIPSSQSTRLLIEFVEDRPGHDYRYAISPNKLINELFWEPKFSFTDSLEETIEWFLLNQKWLRSRLECSGYRGQRIGISN